MSRSINPLEKGGPTQDIEPVSPYQPTHLAWHPIGP